MKQWHSWCTCVARVLKQGLKRLVKRCRCSMCPGEWQVSKLLRASDLTRAKQRCVKHLSCTAGAAAAEESGTAISWCNKQDKVLWERAKRVTRTGMRGTQAQVSRSSLSQRSTPRPCAA